jgi:dTDP-4-amino-4,6-dideoxygalactose transaminase
MFTNDDALAAGLRMIANHGQAKKYYHSVIGVNSRLDTLQAAVLGVKLKYLDEYCSARQAVAARYDEAFSAIDGLAIPKREPDSTHVFHQYTLKVGEGRRDSLKDHLETRGVPSMIYYPLPLYRQTAFGRYVPAGFTLPVTEDLCRLVLSLPIHTEMREDVQDRIIESVVEFFGANAAVGGAN